MAKKAAKKSASKAARKPARKSAPKESQTLTEHSVTSSREQADGSRTSDHTLNDASR